MMQTTKTSSVPAVTPGPGPVSGALGVAAALGFSELLAGALSIFPSLVFGIATFVIDTVPTPIKNWAIQTFGIYDKLVLAIGIVVVALALGAVIGGRRRPLQAGVFVGFGLLAGLAAARSPQAGLVPSLVSGVASAGAGLGVTGWLRKPRPAEDPSRRAFLSRAGAVTALAVLAGTGGRYLIERSRVLLGRREQVVLPPAAETVAPVAASQELAVEGLSPIITPNEDFYRIDTSPFSVPQVDLASWRLRIAGLVDRDVAFSYDDLLGMELVERYITISCVSNEVGGDLIGTARWLGVPLSEILDRAGVSPEAGQIVGRSVDGFTVGFPVEAAYDGRDALVAVGMNGEPLPFEHGFPARLVVAGLYGYVSATKWLDTIELTTWDGFDAYWIPRGWAKEAPIKTQSRIDTPRQGSELAAGPRAIAGVAWAPTRGISAVEVRVDEGEWQPAELSEPLSDDTWVQWNVSWDATPGNHVIQVRATDGTGATQTEDIAPPAPDGATGYHTIQVDVV
jgi:DMSO/TMAO reductase YedYZ molybdopterin-dependent catalytic subunit